MKKSLTPYGALVKKALIEKRMSQRELAAAIGTSSQYLNLVFGGKRSGGKYRAKIASILEIDEGPEHQHTA